MDRSTERTVLMIAYHFPPLRGSSGIHRTVQFCRHLPSFGWNPVVLTAHPRAYESVALDAAAPISPELVVTRAFALNTARHLAIGKHYPRLLAIPDRWVSWLIGGVLAGLALVRRHRARAIYSTYPIATAHLIGLALHRLTGLPWIADFRDPMAQEGYPEDPLVWKSFRWIEERALRHARRALFTSPGAIRDYRASYPEIPFERFVLLENGYDEEAFADLHPAHFSESTSPRLVLLHSGIVYTSERDPRELFRALGILKRRGEVTASDVEFRFRASDNEDLLWRLAQENGVEDLVTLAPPLGHRQALEEMLRADALLILQAANCNSQIPAKAYEYLRANRPILALTDTQGDTADLMRRAGIEHVVPLDSSDAICSILPSFLASVRTASAGAADPAFTASCSREARTSALAALLDNCT